MSATDGLPAVDYAAALAADTARIEDVIAGTPLDAPIPAVPGWTVADAVAHCCVLFELWSELIGRQLEGLDDVHWTPRPPERDLGRFFTEVSTRFRDTFAATDPAQVTWTFWGMHDVAFAHRRIGQEINVHRVDIESARPSGPAPMDPALAADGIDERLALFQQVQPGASVHLHCTDVNGEWLVVPGPERPVVTREHAKGAAAVRGRAEDILLVLWARRPLDTVEVLGDAAMVAAYIEESRL